MKTYALSATARRDVASIWLRIANDSLISADRVQEAIYATCEILARYPALGRRRPELMDKPLLFFPVDPYRKYLIAYEVRDGFIVVARVVHGARQRVWQST